MYVVSIDAALNRVVVGDSDSLLTREVHLREVVWHGSESADSPTRVDAKIRYNMQPQRARLYGGECPKLVFDEPVRAVTPGQIAVAYRGQAVVAGATIC
jgi:tRNA-specific 2-thiouridylase